MANVDTTSYKQDAIGGPQYSITRVYTHAFGASDEPSANDHVRFFKLPKNAKVAFAAWHSTDMDSGAGALDADLILSDGSTDKILIEGGTNQILAAGGGEDCFDLLTGLKPGIGFVTDSDDWYIAADWKVVASTFAAGSLTILIIYTTVLDDGS